MKIKNIIAKIAIALVLVAAVPQRAGAFSLALDSIAEWGKFPRFCVNTYRWGANFFNGYDTTYVVGTGYKFNAKAVLDSWFDYYNFQLPENQTMALTSTPSTSLGVHLTYLAVSVGYDVNVRKVLGIGDDTGTRRRFRFGFNCALFAAELTWTRCKGGTTLRRYYDGSMRHHPGIPFNGVESNNWNVDLYYSFNNKRYSEAGAFNYSRKQLRSQGSWFAGFSYSHNDYDFDFSEMPKYIRDALPASWPDHRYSVNTTNYCLRAGYGYNWVFHPGWVLGVSESPVIGLRSGVVTGSANHNSLSINNRLKASLVWNHGRWFAGAVAKSDVAIVYDRETTMGSAIFSGEISVGYRFNIW